MNGGISIGTGLGLDCLAGGGVPSNALLLNGEPVLLAGQYITITISEA